MKEAFYNNQAKKAFVENEGNIPTEVQKKLDHMKSQIEDDNVNVAKMLMDTFPKYVDKNTGQEVIQTVSVGPFTETIEDAGKIKQTTEIPETVRDKGITDPDRVYTKKDIDRINKSYEGATEGEPVPRFEQVGEDQFKLANG